MTQSSTCVVDQRSIEAAVDVDLVDVRLAAPTPAPATRRSRCRRRVVSPTSSTTLPGDAGRRDRRALAAAARTRPRARRRDRAARSTTPRARRRASRPSRVGTRRGTRPCRANGRRGFRVGVGVRDLARVRRRGRSTEPGTIEVRVVDAVRVELVEEHGLVGEDVRRVVVEVVEREQVVVEEARRARAREHVRGLRPTRCTAAARAIWFDALVAREAVRSLGREVVDDRVPDRARELHEAARRTGRAPGAASGSPGRASFWFSTRARAVVEHERRVAERPVGGRRSSRRS